MHRPKFFRELQSLVAELRLCARVCRGVCRAATVRTFEVALGRAWARVVRRLLLPDVDSQGLGMRHIDRLTDEMIRIDTKVKEDLGIGPFGSGAFSRWRGRAARVTGTVDPRFQSVVPLFVRNFKQRLELGAQLCVYADGRRVVDLTGWSAHRSTASYDGNTLQCVFSTGKNIEPFCVALLVERGLLAYESPIAKYWPAFGQHGKQDVTVADLMRHDAGLSFLSSPGAGGDPSRDFKITPEDVKNRAVAGKIEKCAQWPIDPSNPSGQGRVYHAHTRGLILSELVHRVDPQGRYSFLMKSLPSLSR